MIAYRNGSLFDAPKGAILVHACNVQGVWGSGIAKAFHELFPKSYELYHEACKSGSVKPGDALLLPEENGYRVGCLITSANYAQLKDPPEVILANTEKALHAFLKLTADHDQIHSCKFNAGLFAVPWPETGRVMQNVFEEVVFKDVWTVWEQ